MTGFGAGRAQAGDESIAVEIKSLNHKFCEVKARLPRELGALETSVVKLAKERIARGAVEMTVRRQPASGVSSTPVVDLALAKEYARAYRELADGLGLSDRPTLQQLATQPGVIRVEERVAALDQAEEALRRAMELALGALLKMREVEGKALADDLNLRLGNVEALCAAVAAEAPRSLVDYRARLARRVAELNEGTDVEPQRLAQEVAVFAERTDVAEEAARLQSHLAQFRALMQSSEPAGRKMDFLVQEMHREVNTTGSKSQSREISAKVVDLKAELERLREQVQNVE